MEQEEAVPDHLRCKRTDGRQWRCKRRVMDDDKAYCENHYQKYMANTKKSAARKKNSEKEPVSRKINTEKRTVSSAIRVKEEVDTAGPDCLRCSKTDGHKWRCSRLVIDGDKYCEIHHARVKKANLPKVSVEEGEFVNERSKRQRISTEKVISMIEDESVKEHGHKRRISKEEDESVKEHRQLRRISTKKVKSRKGKEEILPDHLRCNRRDGRQWRCYRPVFENLKLCEIHHLQGQHRQNKQIVPESLKIQRKIRKTLDKPNASPNSKIRSKKSKRNQANLVKRRQWIAISEALDEALKKMKLKKGDLQLELIRMFLQRQVERQKQRDSEAKSQGDLMMYLPNARLSISPSLSPLNFDNAGPFCDVKIGVDSNSIARRCFRSKNIEPLPIGPLKVVPFAKNVANLRRVKRKKCQLAGLAESEQVL